jgi:hypothetical protein
MFSIHIQYSGKVFWLNNHRIIIQFLTGVRDVSLLQSTEMVSRAHQPPILLKCKTFTGGNTAGV